MKFDSIALGNPSEQKISGPNSGLVGNSISSLSPCAGGDFSSQNSYYTETYTLLQPIAILGSHLNYFIKGVGVTCTRLEFFADFGYTRPTLLKVAMSDNRGSNPTERNLHGFIDSIVQPISTALTTTDFYLGPFNQSKQFDGNPVMLPRGSTIYVAGSNQNTSWTAGSFICYYRMILNVLSFYDDTEFYNFERNANRVENYFK